MYGVLLWIEDRYMRARYVGYILFGFIWKNLNNFVRKYYNKRKYKVLLKGK